MACDDEVIPLQERIETVADDADLEEVYNTERHLLTSPAHGPEIIAGDERRPGVGILRLFLRLGMARPGFSRLLGSAKQSKDRSSHFAAATSTTAW